MGGAEAGPRAGMTRSNLSKGLETTMWKGRQTRMAFTRLCGTRLKPGWEWGGPRRQATGHN